MSSPSIPIAPGAQPFLLLGGPVGILIIHGYGGSIGDYRSFGDHLHRLGYTVSGVRVAGHGQGMTALRQTTPVDWRSSVDRTVADLRARVQKIFIVGASFGGILALEYIHRHPGVVTGVIAINPPTSYRGGGRFQKVLLRTLRLFIRDIPKTGLSPEVRKNYATLGSTLAWPITGILDTYDVIQRGVLPALPAITIPTLLMASGHDPIVSGQSLKIIWNSLGSSQKYQLTIPGSTHRPFRDPQSVRVMADQTHQFIQRVVKQS